MAAILGKKVGMTSIYDDKGHQVPVTVIEAGPCQVLQVKSIQSDGYNAVQLGFGEKPARLATKPQIGHAKKAGATPKRFVREYRTDDLDAYKPGAMVTVEAFAEVKLVDVSGVTRGKGMQGPMVRWGFAGQSGSHGTERKHRSPGGIGEGAGIPGRGVRLGKHMAGHQGDDNRTAERLKVIKVDVEANLLVLKGSIPGPDGGYVLIRSAKKVGPVAAKAAK